MADEKTKCPACSGSIQPEWKACPHCGAAITGTETAEPGGEKRLRDIVQEELRKSAPATATAKKVSVSAIEELFGADE